MTGRLPLHELHARAGAVFAVPCGIELPVHYGDPAHEYRVVRHAAGLVDRSCLGLLEVTGADRAAFLHALLTNDIKGLGPGQGCEAALLDVHGKVQALLRVWALEDRVMVVTPPGLAAAVLATLDRYLFSEKAELRDATGERVLLMVAGPRAPELTARLTGAVVPELPWGHVAARVDGVDVRLVRGGAETGEAEVWVVGPADAGPRLWSALVDAGARPVGLAAREALRIEAGTPSWGHDVDPTVLLPELPHARLVSHTKGCYLGQEVVVRIRDRGHVNRHLRGLVVDGQRVPAAGDPLVAGERPVGKITSAAWSYGLQRPVALGFVRREHAASGTVLHIQTAQGGVPATVTELPIPR
jgi:aminomethyltransferase